MKLVTVNEIREIERAANASGWTYANMIEQAGIHLAETIGSYYGYAENRFALALVGSGNNGGDALVALSVLAAQGWQTAVYLVKKRSDSDPFVLRLRAAGGLVVDASSDPAYQILDDWMQEAAVLVDGVLGTGIQLPLREDIGGILAHVRDSTFCPPVVAVDCPSGVDCDSGDAALECIPADVTVCMAAVKVGLLRFPAYSLIGELQVVSIGLPEILPEWAAVRREVIDADYVRINLPQRDAAGHKGTFGTAVIAAGSQNYPGAALLAGMAALRIGTGLVTLAVPATIQSALVGQIPEATWILLANQMGNLAGDAAITLARGAANANVLLFGPGFGLEDCTADFVRKMISNESPTRARGNLGFIGTTAAEGEKQHTTLPPLVIDADGLKLIARIPEWANKIDAPAILTPHPGEMAILTGMEKAAIQADRIGTAARFAQEWGHVVVLKGAFTVIASPDQRIGVIPVATSALAHAGTGDVLAGMITGLRAQGMDAFEAAASGAWLHAHAGLSAEERLGHPACVTASELATSLPEILAWIWTS